MIIEIQQGRTKYLTVSPKNKATKQPYVLQTGDKIRFGVKPIFGGNYVILKKLTSADEINGKYPFVLTPEDTNLFAQRYYYDCSVELADGSVFDISPPDYFIIKDSVTHKGDE